MIPVDTVGGIMRGLDWEVTMQFYTTLTRPLLLVVLTACGGTVTTPCTDAPLDGSPDTAADAAISVDATTVAPDACVTGFPGEPCCGGQCAAGFKCGHDDVCHE